MRPLLTVLAAVLYVFGWLAGLVVVGVLWCWSAMAVGWDDAYSLGRRESAVRPTVGAR